MIKINISIIILLFALSGLSQNSEKRIALVIGNSNYLHGGALKNPVNDANLMAATLQRLGFTVIKKINANLRIMQTASADFKSKLKDYKVALFFYAGHGLQVEGINYLVPVDATLDNRDMAKYDAFSINDINDAFMANGHNTNIMILDACRNDPFRSWTRGGERGFTIVDNPSRGTIIAFATQPGETAADGDGSNGLYTSKLVLQMEIPQSIENVFKETRKAVNAASNGKQLPQDWSSLMDDFYFMKPNANNTQNKIINNNNSEITINEEVLLPGSIKLSSYLGGILYIDGQNKGNISNGKVYNLGNIPAGSHILQIGDWKEEIEVKSNQLLEVNAQGSSAKDLSDHMLDDRDNKSYKIVKIGNQVWMAENLAFKVDNNCLAYDNVQTNIVKYGYLYNWETARNACPVGWHLPSEEDFRALLNNYGGNGSDAYQALIPGGKSGFSALYGGWRINNQFFDFIEENAVFWSASKNAELSIYGFVISKKGRTSSGYYSASGYFSVRCLRNN